MYGIRSGQFILDCFFKIVIIFHQVFQVKLGYISLYRVIISSLVLTSSGTCTDFHRSSALSVGFSFSFDSWWWPEDDDKEDSFSLCFLLPPSLYLDLCRNFFLSFLFSPDCFFESLTRFFLLLMVFDSTTSGLALRRFDDDSASESLETLFSPSVPPCFRLLLVSVKAKCVSPEVKGYIRTKHPTKII